MELFSPGVELVVEAVPREPLGFFDFSSSFVSLIFLYAERRESFSGAPVFCQLDYVWNFVVVDAVNPYGCDE